MILEALPCSSGLSLNFSIPSSSAHRLQTPGCPPSTPRCPSCPPLPPRTGCGCREVKESVGSGRGVASGLDFLKPDRFTTVSWAQDRTAVSYKCPCQSLGREAPLLAEAPRPKAPTALGASPGKGSSSRRRPHSPQVSRPPNPAPGSLQPHSSRLPSLLCAPAPVTPPKANPSQCSVLCPRPSLPVGLRFVFIHTAELISNFQDGFFLPNIGCGNISQVN